MNESHLQTSAPVQSTPATSTRGGLTFSRRFSTASLSPYDDVQWERRTASIIDNKGNSIFEQKDVEVPLDWSMTATNIVARSEERRVGKECRSRWASYQAEDGIRDA